MSRAFMVTNTRTRTYADMVVAVALSTHLYHCSSNVSGPLRKRTHARPHAYKQHKHA